SPVPRWMARLMLSAGMFSALAAAMGVRRRGLVSGSPPPLAAMLISLIRRVKILPRLASSAPFLCLMVAHFEWPDIALPRVERTFMAQDFAREGNHRIASEPTQANRNYSMGAVRHGSSRTAAAQRRVWWQQIRAPGFVGVDHGE